MLYVCTRYAALAVLEPSFTKRFTEYTVRRDAIHHKNRDAREVVIDWSCTCSDYIYNEHHRCKHIKRVQDRLGREPQTDCTWQGELDNDATVKICPQCQSRSVLPLQLFDPQHVNRALGKPVWQDTQEGANLLAGLCPADAIEVYGFWAMPADVPVGIATAGADVVVKINAEDARVRPWLNLLRARCTIITETFIGNETTWYAVGLGRRD